MPCPVSGGTLGLLTPQTSTITGSTLALPHTADYNPIEKVNDTIIQNTSYIIYGDSAQGREFGPLNGHNNFFFKQIDTNKNTKKTLFFSMHW